MDKFGTNVQVTTSPNKQKINLMGYCIICLKKATSSNKQVDLLELKEKSVGGTTGTPSFLNSLNEIWTLLQKSDGVKDNKQNEGDGDSDNCGGGDNSNSNRPRVSIEAVLLEGSTFFDKEPPTMCELCHGKILVLDNLMKAVRRQVRGIQMTLMESRRKGGRLEQFEKMLKDNGLEESVIRSTLQIVDIFRSASVSVQLKQEDCQEESLGFMMDHEDNMASSSQSAIPNAAVTVKSEDIVQGNGADDDVDDDSNWSWDDKDKEPVNIKVEEMDEGDDDDDAGDEEELTSDHDDHYGDEEEEEEFMTLEPSKSIPVPGKDPLEIPLYLKPSISKITTLPTPPPPPPPLKGPSTSSSLATNQMSIFCDEEGCTRTFSTVSALFTHKRNCHPSPAQKMLNVRRKLKNSSPIPPRPRPLFSSEKRKKLYPCDLEACTQKLLSLESLHRHKMTCHSDLMAQIGKLAPPPPSKFKYQCSCGHRFASQEARYLHQSKNQRTHPEFQPIIKKELETQNQICDQCGESVKLSNILKHLKNHLDGSSEYIVKCPNFDECGHMFTHSKDLHGVHLPSTTKRLGNSCRKIAQERKFDLICETCGFKAGKRIRLITHVANEHERAGGGGCVGGGTFEKNLKCPINGCTKMFAVKQSIYFHLHTHRKSPPITNQLCKFCLETIKIDGIGQHLKEKHGILEVIGCEFCPYKFSDREGFTEHLRDHRHVRLSCDICGATFNDNGKLLKHQKEHEDKVEEWKCEVDNCGKIFKKKNSWAHHVNIFHEGKKPFKCDVCGKGFGLGGSLKGHKDSVHLGLRPWGCDECGERFGTSSILKHHMLIHTGERPFECGVCRQRFRHKEVLNRHEKGHEVKGKDFRPNGPMKNIRKRVVKKNT